jgi:hypothetical protein
VGDGNSGDKEDEGCNSEKERDEFVLESCHRVDFVDVLAESDQCEESEMMLKRRELDRGCVCFRDGSSSADSVDCL